MKKQVLGLILLAFLAGGGLSSIIFWRVLPKHQNGPSVIEQVEEYKQTSEAITENKADELDGSYGDVATCPDLLNANTYANDEDYMFMLAGKSPWVFRTRQDLQMDFDVDDKNMALFHRMAESLKQKGTDLVISYIPTRGMIASDYLPDGFELTDDYDAESARTNYKALIERMNSMGVYAVGTPSPAIGAAYFNHADQHWTTQGAKDMAQALSIFIHEKKLNLSLPPQKFKTVQGEEVIYDGRFGEFIKKVCGFRPKPEKDYIVKTERVDVAEDSLLGDASVPEIVLVGTSNSTRDEFNSNFSGYIKEALSADVYNAAISGGGMDDSILAYLSSDMFQKTPAKILIWELPGYYDLGGKGMEYTLRQSIASIAGDCSNPLAILNQAEIKGKKLTLFSGMDNIAASQVYIMFKFDEDVSKDFSISIKTDQENKKIKFKKRREGNGDMFFYLPEGEGSLVSINLNVNKNIEGRKITAKLCPLPK